MSAAAEVATEVVEVVADAAEDTIEALDMINNLNGTTRKQQIIVLVAVGVVAAASGAAVSHFVTKRMLKTKFETLMEEELEKTREFYNSREHIEIRQDIEVPGPEEMLARAKGLDAAVQTPKVDTGNEFLDAGPSPALMKLAEAGQKAAVVERNAFDEADAQSLWQAQNDAAIAEDKPYVISKDTFFESENDWPQITYTWFDGDSVLADEKEQPLDGVNDIVGEMNLTRFGWLSEDPKTVYIRNPEHEVEFEVVFSEGTYASEVHGFTHGEETFERTPKGRGRIRYGADD